MKKTKIVNNFIKSEFLREKDCQQLDELKKSFDNEVETDVNKTTDVSKLLITQCHST